MPGLPRRTHLLASVCATLLTGVLATSAVGAPAAPHGGDAGDTAHPTTPRVTTPPLRYVALGDSFTAAPGVPFASGICARSTQNYPSVLSLALPGTEVVDVSCSAADTRHMLRPQRPFGERVAPQLDALDARTDLVTLGIGGNDFGVFATTIFQCRELARSDRRGAPCQQAMRLPGGGDRLFRKLARTSTRIEKVVAEIQRRSPQAQVLLIGYPELTPPRGTCGKLPLARGDYPYTRRVGKRLNAAVRTAARRRGVEYVDVARASRGHDICSDDPWVNGKDDTDQAIFFHPFANHQAAVAELVLRRLG